MVMGDFTAAQWVASIPAVTLPLTALCVVVVQGTRRARRRWWA